MNGGSAPDSSRQVLATARTLNGRQEYTALAELLEAVPADERLREPELAFLLADVSRRLGRASRALELARAAERPLRRGGHDRLLRARHNLVGMLLFEQGEVDAAERLWLELHADAQAGGDAEFVARATQNLGVIYTLTDRTQDALLSQARAVAAYQRLGHRRGLAQAHQNLAITYRDAGDSSRAQRHFEQAASHARAAGSEDELARVEQERALLLLETGDVDIARSSAESALARFTRLHDPGGCAEVHRVLGLIALATGAHAEARMELERARATGGNRLLDAEVHAALAALEREVGNAGAAAEHAQHGETTFAALGAQAWGRREEARLLRLLHP